MDLESKSLEELEALMADPSKLAELDAAESATPPTETTVAETEVTETTETPTPTETEAPPAATAEPSVEELDKQILQARLEEAEARAKHFESIAGRNAGELGFIRQQIKELKAQRVPPVETTDDLDLDRTPPAAPPPPSPARDKFNAWAVQKAMHEGRDQFLATHSDVAALGGMEACLKQLQDSNYDASAVLESDDPGYAHRETYQALSWAYDALRAQHSTSARAELEKRRADQLTKMSDAKKASTISGGGASTPPPTKAKGLDEMSLSELEGILNAEEKRARL